MNHITPSYDTCRDKPSRVMETIMKPTRFLKSTMLWIGALSLGIGLAAGAPSAHAKIDQWQAKPKNQLPPPPKPGDKLANPVAGEPEITKIRFTKVAEQLDCKHVRFRIRFALWGTDGFWNDPNADHVKEMTTAIQTLTDTLPKGLSWQNVSLKGDIVNFPVLAFENNGHPKDTVKISNIQFTADNSDGIGPENVREWNFVGIAKIDPAEFPNPKIKLNQAKLRIKTLFQTFDALSHNGVLADPADWKSGTPTKFMVDLDNCDDPNGDPGGDPDGEPCIKIEKGEIDCHGPVGPFIYKMPVGPELAGTVIELTSLTPGVIVNPGAQIVPPGGGILIWTLNGAAPGMEIHLLTNNVKQSGPADWDGLATCCTEEIIIEIPEDLPCDEKEPDLQVKKKALLEECDKATGPCPFRIRVKNVGDKKYTGKLALQEWQLPQRAAITGGPNAAWNCNYNLGLALYECTHPALTLNPGEHKDLKLSFTPGNAWPGERIKNCAKLDYGLMGVAPFGDLTNDKDCDSICIKGSNQCPDDVTEKEPELILEKKFSHTECLGGAHGAGPCWLVYNIVISNNGGDFNGPLHVEDNFDIKPDQVTFTPIPPWQCQTVNGQNFGCTHPGINLPSGAQTILKVTAKFIDPYKVDGGEVENCAKLEEGAPGKNEDCATGGLPQPQDNPETDGKPDLTINKQCSPGVLGGLIQCRVMVRNNGDVTPAGLIRVFDVARIIGTEQPIVLEDIQTDGPEWQCEGAPATDLACAIPGQNLTPGTVRYFDAKVRLTGKGRERFRNCATGHHEAHLGDDMNRFGQACVEGGVDIRVEKTGPGVCVSNEECTFDVTIFNDGTTDFSGMVRIADALGLAGEGLTVPVTSIDPPLPCASQPAAVPFICEGQLNLAAGESSTHKITLVFDETTLVKGELRNCAAVMGKGATAQKAGGQENGINGENVGCHNFILEPETQDQCRAPMVMNNNGVCVCPKGTKWNGRRCAGGTIIPPVPLPDPTPICTPGKGEVRIGNRCVCRKGYIRKGPDVCVPPSRGCTPGYGEYKNRKGQCVCKPGFDRTNLGTCVRPPKGCKPGRNEVKDAKGRCVCQKGYQRNKRGFCVKPPKLCKLGTNEFRNSQGQCVCKNGYSRNNYGICMKVPTGCKPGRNEVKDKNGRCVCKPGFKRNAKGFCSKVTQPTPVCKSGKLIKRGKGWYCACPKGWNRKPIGKNGGARCVKPDPKPVCSNGRLVKHGKGWACICPKGWSKKSIGKGGARCIKPKPTPKPVCQAGKLTKRGKSWYCACPKGWNRKPIGKGGARCIKPKVRPKPVCKNGRLLKRGKNWYCACGKGWKRKGLKNGGAICVKPVIKKPIKIYKPKKVFKPKKTFKPQIKKPLQLKKPTIKIVPKKTAPNKQFF
ncbi:MAG: hypothetical protein DHS20C08_09710 [Rhodomicrobium sp.]|nr:MAG: hypothetical protein DHS20C08_09710 [Rhodomicrobium sp.]